VTQNVEMGPKIIQLSWPGLECNICKAFLELREKKELFDVTLACKDGKLKAHRFILSSCSPVFKDIFKENVPLVYMKDTKSHQLEAVLDFMYQGKVEMEVKDLEAFLTLAKEWQVKGLDPDESTVGGSFEEMEVLKFRKPGELFKPTVLGKKPGNLTAGSSAMEMAPENSKEEELKKLEEDNAKLAEIVHSLTAAKKQTEDELAANTAELETLKQASAQDQEETKKQHAELIIREQKDEAEKEIAVLKEEKMKLKVELVNLKRFNLKRVANLVEEKAALQKECDAWKRKCDHYSDAWKEKSRQFVERFGSVHHGENE